MSHYMICDTDNRLRKKFYVMRYTMQIIKGRTYYPLRTFRHLREMIHQSGQHYGSLDAFRFRNRPDDKPVSKTYHQFIDDYQALGTALLSLGLTQKRIAVIGENSYSWCLAHTAILNGVGISVPLDPKLPAEELITLLKRGNVSAVFYQASFHPVMLKAAEMLPDLSYLFCMQSDPSESSAISFDLWDNRANDTSTDESTIQMQRTRCYRFEGILKAGYAMRDEGDRAYDRVPIDENALASLLFTSGTTSQSKAVMLTHRNICSDIIGLSGIIKLKPGTRMLSILPLHHTFENTCGLFVALSYGCEIVICDGLRYIQKNLQEYHIDMIIGVPAVFENFYQKVHSALKKAGKERLIKIMIPLTQGLRKVGLDLRKKVYHEILEAFGGHLSLGICGAAPIDPAIIRFFDAVGLRILQGYGLTETAPVVSGCNDRDFIPGTVGYPISGVEVAVDSPQAGEPGEILVRGPIVMKGYYQDPQATAQVIDSDGWFHTGDVGVLHPKNNFLTITGRLKSMIVLKNGKKVFPEEIEFMINQRPYVKESLVWGESDTTGNVSVHAKIVFDRERLVLEDQTLAEEGRLKEQLDLLIQDINRHLPDYKVIRNYFFSFTDMIKTTTLKIKRTIEIDRIHEQIERSKLSLRELTGQNLDHLTAKLQ